MDKLRNLIFSLFVVCFGFVSMVKADEVPVSNVAVVAGVPIVSGFFGFPFLSIGINDPTFYGYSYYSFYNYQPYYATYGVIAYSKDTDRIGLAWGSATRGEAVSNALDYCNAADCRPVVWVQGGCAAIATNVAAERLGWGVANSKYLAASIASRECKSPGAPCIRRAYVCSY